MDLFELHADICRTLASPTRLRIIAALRHGELPAGEIAARVQATRANASQHLAIMRSKGIVVARRAGPKAFYRLASTKVIQACDLMREVLLEQHNAREEALHD